MQGSSGKMFLSARWQKLREHRELKSLVFIPNIRYFVGILRFVAIYMFYKAFIQLLQDSFLLYLQIRTKLHFLLQFWDFVQKVTFFCFEIATTSPTKEEVRHFLPSKKRVNFCHPASPSPHPRHCDLSSEAPTRLLLPQLS